MRMVRWCSGYHVCFTRRRSRVQTPNEPVCMISFAFLFNATLRLGQLEAVPVHFFAILFNTNTSTLSTGRCTSERLVLL